MYGHLFHSSTGIQQSPEIIRQNILVAELDEYEDNEICDKCSGHLFYFVQRIKRYSSTYQFVTQSATSTTIVSSTAGSTWEYWLDTITRITCECCEEMREYHQSTGPHSDYAVLDSSATGSNF